MKLEIIKNKIYTIRDKQVMLDSVIANLYNVETKVLNQAVKRNIEKFPEDFMFQLTQKESDFLRSQFVTLEKGRGEHRKYLSYVFTEQGIAMLSGILKSKKAIDINISIMRAFVSMRKFLSTNISILDKMNYIESKQIKFEVKANFKFKQLFDKFEINKIEKKEGVFFEGQVFDSYVFISSLIKKAKKEIILIDNYIDENTLEIFTKNDIKVKIYTKNVIKLDLDKLRKQYNNIEVKLINNIHDCFLVIDEEIYHIGASLKDLGNKLFAFSKLSKENYEIIKKLIQE